MAKAETNDKAQKLPLSTYVTAGLYSRLQAYRRQNDLTLTEIVEKAVAAYLNRRKA